MSSCIQCGKRISFLKAPFCSESCKEKWKELNKKRKEKDKEMKSKGMVKETKCICNQCGKVWHYLPSEKFFQDSGEFGKDLIQSTACCCNPFGILIGGLRQKPKELDQCPKCNSKNVKKETVYYKKKA